jgi:hypothetical protein
LVALFFPVAGHRSIFAFTNPANRTITDSTIASTRNCKGVSCCKAEAPAHTQPLPGLLLLHLAADGLALAFGVYQGPRKGFALLCVYEQKRAETTYYFSTLIVRMVVAPQFLQI